MIATSLRSVISGRISPDLSSDRNGSRPAPWYEKTSRDNESGPVPLAAAALRALSARAVCAASAGASHASVRTRLRTRIRGSRRGDRHTLHVGSQVEVRFQQGAHRVADEL